MAATKQKKKFTALLVAIVVIIAAIGFVLFDEISSHSSFLENKDFSDAISAYLGKRPSFVKPEELAQFCYVGVNYQEGYVSVSLAKDKAVVPLFLEYLEKYDAGEEADPTSLQSYITGFLFEADEAPILDDIKYFTGAEVLEVYGVPVTDSSVYSGMTNLAHGTISTGISEVAGFAGVNAEKLVRLNLSGNTIEDWSALEPVADKVIVSSSYMLEPAEDGSIDFNNMKLVETTLKQQMEEDEKLAGVEEDAAAKAEADAAQAEADVETEANTDTEATPEADEEAEAEPETLAE